MRKLLLLFCWALVFTLSARAQEETPKAEIFGGYSYVRFNPSGTNFNGGSGSFAYNLTDMFGAVADFGGYHNTTAGVGSTLLSYTFGPKVTYRRGRGDFFGQALFGGAHFSALGAGINSFAMQLGGGVDWSLTDHFGVRPIQAEYFYTHFSGTNQNNARISVGVVYRW